MTLAALAWVLVAAPPPGPSPAEVEAVARRAVRLAFEARGRAAPAPDPRLDAAARMLASTANTQTVTAAADALTVADALSTAGAHDPSPHAVFVRGHPAEEVLAALKRRDDLGTEPATHLGVGVARNEGRVSLVVLTLERRTTLESFPRHVDTAPRAPRSLCGRLAPGHRRPELFVTRPNGQVARLSVQQTGDGRFCAPVPLAGPGRYAVEVLANSERGPVVAALFFTDVGARNGPRPSGWVEQHEPGQARAAILARVNALRTAHGAPPLQQDAALEQVAQRYAQRMAREGFLAHVDPSGGDLRARLTAGGYAYRTAGENLGLAAGPVAAHLGVEQSPAHRRTLLDGAYTRLGLGIARASAEQTVVVELFAAPSQAPTAPPEQLAYSALAAERRKRRLPPMVRSPALEQVAAAALREAVRVGKPTTRPGGLDLHAQAFRAEPAATRAAADIFVLDDASLAATSDNAADPRHRTVGAAAMKSQAPSYPGVWLLLVYTDARPKAP